MKAVDKVDEEYMYWAEVLPVLGKQTAIGWATMHELSRIQVFEVLADFRNGKVRRTVWVDYAIISYTALIRICTMSSNTPFIFYCEVAAGNSK